MIIAVQGTHEGNRGSAKLLSALSFYGIRKEKKRTLVLQFANRTQDNVENYLIGRSLRNESLIQDATLPDISIGMDALCVNGAFSGEIFDECTRHLVTGNVKNLYDVAVVTRKDSFEKEILAKEQKGIAGESYLGTMLHAADGIYDLVFCLLPSKNTSLCQEILEYADVNLICIRQGRAENINQGGKRTLFVAVDYCSGSMYHSRALAKEYGCKTIYGLMHYVPFMDACAEGTVLSFMQRNISCGKNDAGYPLVHNLDLLYQAICTSQETSAAEEPKMFSYLPEADPEAWLSPTAEKVVQEVTETGIFKKKKNFRLTVRKSEKKVQEAETQSAVQEDAGASPEENGDTAMIVTETAEAETETPDAVQSPDHPEQPQEEAYEGQDTIESVPEEPDSCDTSESPESSIPEEESAHEDT